MIGAKILGGSQMNERIMRTKRSLTEYLSNNKQRISPGAKDIRTKRIQDLYYSKKMLQHEIAEMLAISQKTVSMSLRGR